MSDPTTTRFVVRRPREGRKAAWAAACVALAAAMIVVHSAYADAAARDADVLGALALASPRTEVDQDLESQLAACIADESRRKGLVGGSVAVLQDGEVVVARGFGRKHRSTRDTVNERTQFRTGSTTKQFTAAGVMRLVDRGLVDLDAPVTDYVPELRFADDGAAQRVTIRDLLQHTSGVPDTSAMERDDMFGPNTPEALAEWVADQATTRTWAPPGRFYNYSSANYMYLGRVIEAVSGQPFQDYMSSEVLAPAGLTQSTFWATDVVARDNYAFGHWRDIFDGGTLLIVRPTEMDSWARHPTGYLHSTTSVVRLRRVFGPLRVSGHEAPRRRRVGVERRDGVGARARLRGRHAQQHGVGAARLGVLRDRSVPAA
jgi:CubicO group peptidase (beta-lactamase class C family)